MMNLQHFRLTTILLALVCFVMPWFQFQCNGPDGSKFLVEQSGLQATYGGTTYFVNGQVQEAPAGQDPEPAWLLTVFGAAMLLALLASQWMKLGNRRWLAVTLLTGVAAGTLVVQIAQGFPVFEKIPFAIPKEEIIYTPWYWIAIVCTIASPIISLCERVQLRAAKPPWEEPTVERPAWGE